MSKEDHSFPQFPDLEAFAAHYHNDLAVFLSALREELLPKIKIDLSLTKAKIDFGSRYPAELIESFCQRFKKSYPFLKPRISHLNQGPPTLAFDHHLTVGYNCFPLSSAVKEKMQRQQHLFCGFIPGMQPFALSFRQNPCLLISCEADNPNGDIVLESLLAGVVEFYLGRQETGTANWQETELALGYLGLNRYCCRQNRLGPQASWIFADFRNLEPEETEQRLLAYASQPDTYLVCLLPCSANFSVLYSQRACLAPFQIGKSPVLQFTKEGAFLDLAQNFFQNPVVVADPNLKTTSGYDLQLALLRATLSHLVSLVEKQAIDEAINF